MRVGDSAFSEIVGVIADMKDQSLTGAARRRFYVPYLQAPLGDAGALRLVVRTNGDPVRLRPAVQKAIGEMKADLPIRSIPTLTGLMRQSISEERLLATLATAFGAAALLLAAIGLYGVMSYAVTDGSNRFCGGSRCAGTRRDHRRAGARLTSVARSAGGGFKGGMRTTRVEA
jgi:putative ABC transport system permease protein